MTQLGVGYVWKLVCYWHSMRKWSFLATDTHFSSLKGVPIDLLNVYIVVKIVINIMVIASQSASFDIFLAFIIPIVSFSYFYEINFQLCSLFSYFRISNQPCPPSCQQRWSLTEVFQLAKLEASSKSVGTKVMFLFLLLILNSLLFCIS